jgi:hypothetical protein
LVSRFVPSPIRATAVSASLSLDVALIDGIRRPRPWSGASLP